MKSVLLSIKPKYCELIASGKKTLEIRKTRPKIDAPFKVYIYCTKRYYRKGDGYFQGKYCGKVIGEFICDEIYTYKYSGGGYLVKDDISTSISCRIQDCLTDMEFRNYLEERDGYGWHISNLVIYDKPRELSEFRLKCPPQSWCYVEEVQPCKD